MAFSHGSKAYFALEGTSNGAATDISAYVTEVSFSQEIDTPEVSTFGVTNRKYIAGLNDATLEVSGIWDPSLDAIFGDPTSNSPRAWTFGPAGSGTGAIKYSGDAIISSFEISGGVDDAIEWKAEFVMATAVTRGTF
jgi:hypothetical protein